MRELRLRLVEVGGRQPDGDVEGDDREDRDGEAGEDGPPGGAESVALGEDVAEDVGQGEEEEGAVGYQWPDDHALGGQDVGDEEHRDEDRHDDGIVSALQGDEAGAVPLPRC